MTATARRARGDALDIFRALALFAMVGYHLIWDLSDFGFIGSHAPFTPAMRIYSHTVASMFLLIVGISLALAHQNGAHWRGYFFRLSKVAAAALLVTLASSQFAPGFTIWFGILHLIVAASLFAAPLLFAPIGIGFAVGVAALVIGFSVHVEAFDPPALMWLGIGTYQPWTLDWRPLLPWAGMAWIGLDLGRFALSRFASAPLWTWHAQGKPLHLIAWLGRHSLAFYLLHQLPLFALLYAFAWMLGSNS